MPLKLVLISVLFLSSCANVVLNSYVARGQFKVDTSDDKSYDYKFSLIKVKEFDIDTDKPADRKRIVQTMLAKQCATPKIIDEKLIITNTGIFGEAGNWLLKVKCETDINTQN